MAKNKAIPARNRAKSVSPRSGTVSRQAPDYSSLNPNKRSRVSSSTAPDYSSLGPKKRSAVSRSTAPDYSSLKENKPKSRTVSRTAPNYSSLRDSSKSRTVSGKTADYSSLGGSKPRSERASTAPRKAVRRRGTGGLEPFPESKAERDAYRKAKDTAARKAVRSAAGRIAGKTGGVAAAVLTPDTVQAATTGKTPKKSEYRDADYYKRYSGSAGMKAAQSDAAAKRSVSSRGPAGMSSAPKKGGAAKKPTLTKAEIDKSMKAFEAMTPEMPAKSSRGKMPSVRATAARSSVSGNRMSPKPTAKKRKTTTTGVTKPKSVQRGTARTPDSERAVKTVKTKGGDYKVYKKDSAQAKSFRKAYADAVAKRKELGKKAGTYIFDWNGKKYKA